MGASRTLTLNSNRVLPSIGVGLYLIPLDTTATVVEQALSIGYRQLDTARSYGNETETAVGVANFLKAHSEVKRSDVFYTTKIWPDEYGYKETIKAIEESFNDVKDSIGYIDMILLHSPVSEKEKRLESYRALQEAVDKGIVRSIGVSNYGVSHLEELFQWKDLKYPPAVNQLEINPWLQRRDIVAKCQEHNIVVQASSPLTFGNKLGEPIVTKLAEKYRKTPAQILIRWSLQKGYVPLPKSIHERRLKENFDVFDFEIDSHDMNSLGDPSASFLASPGPDPTKHP